MSLMFSAFPKAKSTRSMSLGTKSRLSYKGKKQINDTTIEIPKPFNNKKQSQYQQNKLKKQFRGRAAKLTTA